MGDGYRMSQSFAFPAGVASSYKGVSLFGHRYFDPSDPVVDAQRNHP
jgi:hypothetical protein